MNQPDDVDQRVVQEMIGRFDAPSFIRRAKLVETTWTQLLRRAEQVRAERIEIVRLRLGQLRALAGEWERLRPELADDADLANLKRLEAELRPRLRLPLEQTPSRRVLRSALRELIETMTLFNERWSAWLGKLDLRPVNEARDAYNRFYLLEKECALGSTRVARSGFQRLGPVTRDDVASAFPLLSIPRRAHEAPTR